MKPFAAQSYYELLEISVSASTAEVRAAWDRLNRMYADDQLALYGLATAGSATLLRKRLREAVDVLSDAELRAMYDEELGLPARDPSEDETQQLEMGELLAGADHSLVSTHPRVAFTWSEPAAPGPLLAPAPTVIPAPAAPDPVSATPAPTAAAAALELPAPADSAAPAPALVSSEPLAPEPANRTEPRPAPSLAPPREEAERLSEEAAVSMLPRSSPRSAVPPPVPSAPERPKLPDLPPDAEYNGELLRKVRTALGLSLATVAERTRIAPKHLENVEADRYDALPATVYLRGILVSLAKELRLDGLKVSKSYLSVVERIRAKG